MRKILFIIILVSSSVMHGQSDLKPGTRANDAYKSVKDGYTTDLGWHVRAGDTIQIGIGSRDRESFSNIYSSPNSFVQMMGDGSEQIKYLTNDYNNMIAVVKKFGVKGKRKTGYLAYAVVGIGEMENYWIEIENAIANHEIIAPDPKHRSKIEAMEVKLVGGSSDKYDQLSKIKALLDEGVLSQDEYEAEKKKILDQ